MTAPLVADLDDEQLRILRHMLGIDDPYMRVPKPYRNYYCANRDYAPLQELERLGMVRQYRVDEHYHWYTCTESGRLAGMRSHKAIRKTKAQRVYSKFLNVRDCWPDLTFREFITATQFAKTRSEA